MASRFSYQITLEDVPHSSGVYKIENVLNGKFYVGSAKSMKRRLAQHRTGLRGGYHQNKHLQNAWCKYGESAFVFTILLFCAPKHVRFYEQRALDIWKPAYNLSTSAYSGVPIGATLSAARREKIRISSTKQWTLPEYRAKVTYAIKAAMTEEECTKRKARTAQLWSIPEYRAKSINARKGNAYCVGYRCTPAQVLNRKRAGRISNMKRNYGDAWKEEYIRRYPEYAGDVNGE